ncbi:hypothetical protein LAZ67_5003259 [Cordylochernes scorpioides]|uniref:Uncharacterized protein n=1 Tax=Cordylochernes scorpioides TaxID=51811 RepID=A0ABY6KK82_9ARAC|nr:hypothetical protein LAZ67_5003259 [Cordylochernes scorpioides]
MKGMRERLDSGLVQIERRLEEWDKRAQEMESKITQSMEAQCNTDKRVDGNTLQLRELEARMEYTEARLREQNLIFYGIVREENENPFDCNRKVKSIITDKMGFTDEVKITKCHRLSRAENSPVLAVIPDHEERARVLSNAIKLKGSKIFISKDYSLKCHIESRQDHITEESTGSYLRRVDRIRPGREANPSYTGKYSPTTFTYELPRTSSSTRSTQERSPCQSRTPPAIMDKTPPSPYRYCDVQH